MDDTQRQHLEKVLRRLHAGLKTLQLYSASHTAARSTVQDVTASLRGYLQRYGAIALLAGKDRLQVDGLTLTEGGVNALAFFLYVRNLATVAILPGISDQEVADLLSILSPDRQAIEASGGIERLALSRDLPHVVLKAITLKESIDALSEAGLVQALTQTRRLSPEQREVVFAVLRNGPADAAVLLVRVQDIAGGPSAEGDQVNVEQLLTALGTLDRAILDETIEDQEALLQNLAQGVLQLDEAVRAALAPELVSHAVEGGSGRAILSELTGQELALLILGPLAQGEMAARLSKFLAGLRLPEDKAAEVSAFLQKALAAGSSKVGSFAATLYGPPPQPDVSEEDAWAGVDPALITFTADDAAALDRLRSEVAGPAVTRDAIRGLINLLGLQERPEEIAETARALTAHLMFLADQRELDLLTIAIQLLHEARGRTDAHRAAIDAEFSRVLNSGLLDRLVRDALQAPADGGDDLIQALAAVSDLAVPHLVHLLEREPEAARRQQLCKLLAQICAGRADLIGAHLPGVSWHLTRNLAFVLGELRDPSGAAHLARLASHPEYRVRREAIDALRKIPSDQSRLALLEFLRDPDPRIQFSLIEGGNVPDDARVVEWMQHVIRSPDVTPAAVAAKVAAMKALARMGVDEALSLLRRIARMRWVFGQGRRTVREAARQIVDHWERSKQRPS